MSPHTITLHRPSPSNRFLSALKYRLTCSLRAIGSAEYPAKAQRPAYSVLDTERLRTQFGVLPPPWQVGVEHTLLEIAQARRSLAGAGFEVKRC